MILVFFLIYAAGFVTAAMMLGPRFEDEYEPDGLGYLEDEE